MEKERPIECGGCQKPLSVEYKQIIGQEMSCSHMCNKCPILESRLHGQTAKEKSHLSLHQELCCNGCHTSLQDVQSGGSLGCSECYSIFSEAILDTLKTQELIAPHMGNSLHVGKTPHDAGQVIPSKRITELNEELNNALAKENYEEAAWLRDQIKELMEKSND